MLSVSKVDVLNGKISKQLMYFFYPILFGNLFQQIYNIADAVIVGKFLGKNALAAVGGSTGILIDLFVGFTIGISSGASVVVAQSYGRRDYEKLSKTLHTSIALCIILSLIFSFVGLVFGKNILIFLNVPSEILNEATTYLRVLFAGIIFPLLFNFGNGILRAVGDSKRPLYFLIVASFTNIFLDIIFVYYFKMGVIGAGLATVISQALSAFLVLLSLYDSEDVYNLNFKKIEIDKEIIKEVLKIGVPAGIQSSLYSLANITIQSSVNKLGTDYVAAMAAEGKIDSLVWMVISSFGISVTTFSAQNFGARNIKRVKESIWIDIKLSFIFTSIISLFFYFFGKHLFSLFVDDPHVIDIGVYLLKFYSHFFVIYLPLEAISGALRGVGDSLIPTIITLLGVGVFRVIWIFTVFEANPKLENIMYIYPISWILTSTVFIFYYFVFKPIDKRI